MSIVKSRLRLYLNTDVIWSLLTDEPGKGENVAKLLYQAADGKYQVLVSEHTAYELLKLGVPLDYISHVLRPLLLLNGSDILVANSDIMRSAERTMRQYEMPFMRALHVVFAQRNNSLVLTRDLDFINAARSLVGVMTPEDLL
ncbi:MAG TPA: PIN domain-containing protein [Methanocella sp.]|uniref:PIN domain-containing protein n=1 Tax=Methanocella sp. TaxID=2052833 RepID=UPI002CDC76AA|nr:PIN domain-containing protein [Methanocella sp.]HTY89954.1 PIN domain-containing protein [Methanocella sp.]